MFRRYSRSTYCQHFHPGASTLARYSTGNLNEVIACYRRALELRPDIAETYNNIGSALEEIGDLWGAEDGRTMGGHPTSKLRRPN